MLLNTVIIISREVVEASLLISVLLAYSHKYTESNIWLGVSLFLGVLGAVFYGVNIATVSEYFDGVGQEVLNASMHLVIYLMLSLFLLSALSNKTTSLNFITLAVIGSIVMTVTIREGSEIYVYLQGYYSLPVQFESVVSGALIGLGIGISVGVFFYYLLVHLSLSAGIAVGFLIVILEAGSMVSQSIQLLMQADWITQGLPIWNSSNIVSEQSVLGQLLYALVGYEATPTAIQFACYVISISVLLVLSSYQILKNKSL